LKQKGLREATITTNKVYFKRWFNGDFQQSTVNVLDSGLVDKKKQVVLYTLKDFAEFLHVHYY